MVFVIGEIGTSHNGSIDITKKIIDVAVNTGFDAVKFQKRIVEKLFPKEFPEKNDHAARENNEIYFNTMDMFVC